MNENDDSIFSITIQQASSTYDQDSSLVHPPDNCPSSSRASSKASRNPRHRKTKLERAKEMLLNGQDLPRSFYMDEKLFPDLVDSLQADYNKLMNPKSRKNRSQNQSTSNYATDNYESTTPREENNNSMTYNPHSKVTFNFGDDNFSKTNPNNADYQTGADGYEAENDESTNDFEDQQSVSVQNINTKVLKSSEVVYKALKKAQEYYQLFLANKEKERIQEEIKGRLKSAKNEKRELIQMIQNQEKNMALIFEDEENDLVKKHDKEIKKLNATWESEQKQRVYNKSSDTLRLLRRQADLLLMDKQYQESMLCQKKAQELEAAEIENQRAAMANDYEQSLTKLQTKQRKEMKNLKVRHKMKRNEYIAAKNEELAKANNKIAKIEKELENSNDPFFINRIKKSQEMEANSINCFTASKYRNSNTTNNRQTGPNVVSARRPAPRSNRNFGKMEVTVADFNQVPLPPLRTDFLIYKAQTARK